MRELERIRNEALAAKIDDPLVAEYHRNSINIGWQDMAGVQFEQQTAPLLDTFRVEVLGIERIPSSVAAAIASGVQRATTQMDAALRNPHAARTPGTNRPLTAEIVQEGLAGNSLIFRVPAVLDPHDDVLQLGPQPGRASGALSELLNALPENAGDFGAFARRVERSPQMERQAIQTISTMALETPNGVSLDLNSERRFLRSTLDRGSAIEVDEFLQRRKFRRTSESVSGLLDGFRGTRRVFYLITDDGREIAGSVDDHLLAVVQRLANRRVEAGLSAMQWVARNGSLGPKHYELVRLQPESDPQGLFA
jgi:hypothetical protein